MSKVSVGSHASGTFAPAPLDALGTLASSGIVTLTGLNLPHNIDRAGWEQLGIYIGALHNVSRWAIGQWLIEGEQRWGELYAQGMEATGLAYETLTNYANVCRSVAPPRRRTELSFSHHAEVAKLEPDVQEHWLQRAVDEHLSRRDLRELIRPPIPRQVFNGVPSIETVPVHRCPACGEEWN